MLVRETGPVKPERGISTARKPTPVACFAPHGAERAVARGEEDGRQKAWGRVGSADEWEQIELLCAWPEQERDEEI